MLQNSINGLFGIGEKYLGFLLFLCVDTCDQFPKLTLIGLKCHKIPKPMLDYSVDGYHYLLASKRHQKWVTWNVRYIILESENDIKNICDTFTLQKHLLLKYLNHLRYLKIEQEKKKLKLRKKQNQQSLSE